MNKSRKDNEETLKTVINRLIKTYKLDEGLMEQELISVWEKQMGPAIASRTEFIRFNKGDVKIKLTSSTLRNELEMGKSQLIKVLNDALGNDFIKSIQLT
ncbi:MAG: DUF721 domain-containing protein [Flavobacteriales bacterium]